MKTIAYRKINLDSTVRYFLTSLTNRFDAINDKLKLFFNRNLENNKIQ